MKYLLLLLTSLSLQASLDELDLTLPEQPAVYISPEKKFFFNVGDYNEPPTKNQMIVFWTLNVLDVYTTHEGMRKCSTCEEQNLLLPKRPSLEDMLLQKAIFTTLLSKNSSKRYMTVLNVSLTYAVINNYNILKDY